MPIGRFIYKNQNIVASGTYGGINTKNGHVTDAAILARCLVYGIPL